MIYLVTGVIAYFIGSIPFGFLIARQRGLDIRSAGSGNIGATNVMRQLGRRAGLIVFLLDFAKGALPTFIGLKMSAEPGLALIAGLSSLLGHMFPVWLKFRGGKGVATGTGVVTVLFPGPTLIAGLVWAATLSATRFVSLASIFAAAVIAGCRLMLTSEPFADAQRMLSLFAIAAFLLVTLRHAGNIRRLWDGRENQASESATMRGLGKVIHVLAMGLWFGANVFFSLIAAVLIFKTWEAYGDQPLNDRPTWLPVTASFNKAMGTRIAGATVGPIFPFFFLMQGVCAFLALVTALGFSRWEPTCRVHRLRFAIVLLAALTVIVGWPLAQKVGALWFERYHHDPVIAQPADDAFKRLHVVSLFLNFGTIGLISIGMALAAFLPPSRPNST